ncbi:MAG TPA: hypothetical protein PLP87_09025 [Clostridiales bacterium]|nr:hypothetical protein [Clostridiales bacterium]
MTGIVMLAGAIIFAAGVIVGAKLEWIIDRLGLRKQNPLEGQYGLLSYRNLLRGYNDMDDDDID